MNKNAIISISVAIPCYNEEAAIAQVIASWRDALPEARILVFDNYSTDRTAEVASNAGIEVVSVPEKGKGYAVRAIFRTLAESDALILVDGDGTYPASEARKLLAPILDGSADMSVGSRRPEANSGSMAPIRGLGNVLIRAAFHVLIGRGPGDLLSGYRVFSRRFLAEVKPRSTGFEIETEITGESVARGYRVAEIAVPYFKRIAGTESKLNAFRDGGRILFTILRLAFRLRPQRITTILVALVTIIILSVWLRNPQ